MPNYGPPVIRCAQYSSLVKTGWHKRVNMWDKIQACLPIIVGLGWLIFIFTRKEGDVMPKFLVGAIGFLIGLFGGWSRFRLIKKYENSVEANSDDIPTW